MSRRPVLAAWRPPLAARSLALLIALLAQLAAWCPARSLAEQHAVIVSIDGLRPDVALRADMPALRALMARGSFTMYATATDTAVTLPSHVSMLTGVSPDKHGILYNRNPRPGDRPAPAWPTIFALARRAGLRTAMAVGKSKLSVLASDGGLDLSSVPRRGETAADSAVAEVAARWLEARRPHLLFVHLPELDGVGHDAGWGSPAQVQAASRADRALGRVLAALDAAGLADSTLVLVTADHGGAGTSHGGRDARSRLIPWVAAGPGVPGDYDLTRDPQLQVRTVDVFATACAWLGIAPEKPVDGRAVIEVPAASP